MGFPGFLLALSTAWTHAGLRKGMSGDLCVNIFYAFSGFYMSIALSKRRGCDVACTFYKQSLLRLSPTSWLLLVLPALLGRVIPNQSWRPVVSLNLPSDHLLLFIGWALSQLFKVGQDALSFMEPYLAGSLRFRPNMDMATVPLVQAPTAESRALIC